MPDFSKQRSRTLALAVLVGLTLAGAVLFLADRSHHLTAQPVSAHFARVPSAAPSELNLTAVSSDGERMPFKRSSNGTFFLPPFPLASLEISGAKSLLENASPLYLHRSAHPKSQPDHRIEWSPREIQAEAENGRAFLLSPLPEGPSVFQNRPWTQRGDATIVLYFLGLAAFSSFTLCSFFRSPSERDWTNPSLAARPLRHLLIPAAGALSTVGLLLFFLHAKFGGPDELHQMSLVRGRWSIPASGHLIFSHVFIGHALRFLYETWRDLTWYSIHITLALTAVAGTFVWVIGVRRGRPWLACAILLGILAPIWTNVQFTSTAGAMCCSGFLLLWLAAHDQQFRFRNPLVLVGGTFVLWGSMIRFESFVHLSLVFLPILLLAIRPIVLRPRPILKAATLAPLFAVLALGVALEGVNRMAYERDPEWKAFRDLQPIRVQINDYRTFWNNGVPADVDSALAKAQWTRNDLYLFDSWFYLDPKFLDPASVGIVAAAAQTPRFFDKLRVSNLANGFLDFLSSLLQFKLGLLFLAVLLAAFPLSKQAFGSVLVLTASLAVLHIVIVVLAKPPPFRVFFPPLLGLFTVVTYQCLATVPSRRSGSWKSLARWTNRLCLGLAAMLLTYGYSVKFAEGQKRFSDASLFRSECEWMDRQPEANVYIWGDAFRFDLSRFPLGELDLPEKTPLVLGAYVMTTPPGRRQLDSLGWNPPHLALYQNSERITYLSNPPSEPGSPSLPGEANLYLRLLEERLVSGDAQFVILHRGPHWVSGKFLPIEPRSGSPTTDP